MSEQKTWLDRALSVVTDVRSGEGVGALHPRREHLLPSSTFYSVLKIIRDALILTQGGAEIEELFRRGPGTARARVRSRVQRVRRPRVDRMRLISLVTLFFASTSSLFAVLGLSGIQDRGSCSSSGPACSAW